MIERHIIIGLITSTEFCRLAVPVINIDYLQSEASELIAKWCIDYYSEYKEAPLRNIELIYQEQVAKQRISKELAAEMENEILPQLSEEYERMEVFNVKYVFRRTIEYMNKRYSEQLAEEIKEATEKNDTEEVQRLIDNFKLLNEKTDNTLELTSEMALERLKQAFEAMNKPLFQYPGALGDLLNGELVRGSLIGIQAAEKRGKTWWLIDMMLKAFQQKLNIAFFQAGDMTESQFLRRMVISLAKKSDKERYTGVQYIPVKDCVHNQLDTCTKDERTSPYGCFAHLTIPENEHRKELTREMLIEAYNENKDYNPCHDCLEFRNKPWGVPWLTKVDLGDPLTGVEAVKAYNKFFKSNHRHWKLSTHATRTLTVRQIDAKLTEWEEQEGFIADLVVVDYADILAFESKEHRHGQNEIWMGLRRISQEWENILVVPTQADSGSYKKESISLDNYSEDKRKYSHVTAMVALNQDPKGREKAIGIMRVDLLLSREEDSSERQVYVLQKIGMGRPVLASYY